MCCRRARPKYGQVWAELVNCGPDLAQVAQTWPDFGRGRRPEREHRSPNAPGCMFRAIVECLRGACPRPARRRVQSGVLFEYFAPATRRPGMPFGQLLAADLFGRIAKLPRPHPRRPTWAARCNASGPWWGRLQHPPAQWRGGTSGRIRLKLGRFWAEFGDSGQMLDDFGRCRTVCRRSWPKFGDFRPMLVDRGPMSANPGPILVEPSSGQGWSIPGQGWVVGPKLADPGQRWAESGRRRANCGRCERQISMQAPCPSARRPLRLRCPGALRGPPASATAAEIRRWAEFDQCWPKSALRWSESAHRQSKYVQSGSKWPELVGCLPRSFDMRGRSFQGRVHKLSRGGIWSDPWAPDAKFAQNCPGVSQRCPDSGHVGPMSAKSGPLRAKLGQRLAALGQAFAKL